LETSAVPGSVTGAVNHAQVDESRPLAVPAEVSDDLWSAIPGAVFGVHPPAAVSEEGDGAAFVSQAEQDEVSTSLLLGVVIPISIIIVVSVVGNVLLVNKLRRVNDLRRQMKHSVSVMTA
jgi:hypothetical protein